MRSGPGGWTSVILYTLLCAAVTVFLNLQFGRSRDLKLALLEEQAVGILRQLDLIAKASTDQINGMRNTGERHLLHARSAAAYQGFPVEQLLRASEHFPGFALDLPPDFLETRHIGNLTGVGDPGSLSTEHLRELRMAFLLNADFWGAFDAIPNLAWVYYTSARSFQNVMPWLPTKDNHWSDESLKAEFYTLGLPDRNPGRKPFWTAPYVDAYGKGLMITGGAPVYDGEQFVGTVALDFTLDYLDAFLRDRELEMGTSFIVMNNERIIAHQGTPAKAANRSLRLSEVVPDVLEEHIIGAGHADGPFVPAGEHYVLRRDIAVVPWTYVHHLGRGTINAYVFSQMLPEFAVAALVLLMVLAVERVRRSKREVESTRSRLENLSRQLSRYLSPPIYAALFSGRSTAGDQTKRKKLTVFFSDIQNFTATAEDLAPEDLTALLNDYLTEMSTIALEHGGTIDKYIGDAIVIFFGDPESRGNQRDAEACVRMALAMQTRMHGFRAKWKARGIAKPFHVRVGINTGFCHVGNFGSDQQQAYTIIGGAVNLAARLESVCQPDGVVLSHDTYMLAKDIVDARQMDAVDLKGIAKEVRPWAVTGILAEEDGRYIHLDHEGVRLFVDLQDLERMDSMRREEVAAKLESASQRLRKIHDALGEPPP